VNSDREGAAELRVLHALRLKSFADVNVVAAAAGLDVATTQTVLDALAEAGFVKYREGRITGWMQTPAGRIEGETLLAQQLDDASKRADLEAIYQRFLVHNQPFLSLCTEWQVRTIDGQQLPNDHADAAYDASVIERLGDANTAIQPICTDLATMFERFAHYGPSFTNALSKVQNGDTDWFTKPMIESYHTTWFELHEDLLASLGLDRVKESHA